MDVIVASGYTVREENMKGLLGIALAASIALSPQIAAQGLEKPSFAETTWYSNKAAIRKHLTGRGYIFLRTAVNNLDLIFTGNVNGIPARIFVAFNDKDQLVKTSVIFEGTSAKNSYDSTKAALSAKYGRGMSQEVQGLPNYDGILEYYIKDDAKHETTWVIKPYNYVIWLHIGRPYNNEDAFFTMLDYESPAWAAEFNRRNKNGDL